MSTEAVQALADRDTAQGSIIRRILFSFATASVAFGISYAFDAKEIRESILLSVLIGGVTIVVQFLHDLEGRLRLVEQELRAHSAGMAHLSRTFAEINQMTELHGQMEAAKLRADMAAELLRHAAQIGASAKPIIHDIAQAEMARAAEFIKALGDGSDLTYEGEDRDWLLGLARHAKVSIDAISLATVDAGDMSHQDGLWASDLGQRYLDTQREVANQGVLVRRIFVLDQPDATGSPDLQRVYDLHRQMGIQVRTLDPRLVHANYRSSLFDFIVFDRILSYETTPASRVDGSTRPIIVNTRIVQKPEVVAARLRRFEELWDQAEPSPGLDQ